MSAPATTLRVTHIPNTAEARLAVQEKAGGFADLVWADHHSLASGLQTNERLLAGRAPLMDRVRSAPLGATVLMEGIAHVPDFQVPAAEVEADVRTLLVGRTDLDVYLVTQA